jgi:hypothetical protein
MEIGPPPLYAKHFDESNAASAERVERRKRTDRSRDAVRHVGAHAQE